MEKPIQYCKVKKKRKIKKKEKKTLILGKTENKRRRGHQSMRSLDIITNSIDMSLSKLQEIMGFPDGSDGKESAYNAGYPGLLPGLGRSPGEGNVYPLQYSCLGNSMDRGAWRVTVHGVARSWT